MKDAENKKYYVNNQASAWEPLALGLALVLGFLFWGVFAPERFGVYGSGVGVPVFVAVYFAAVVAVLGKNTHWNARSIVPMGGALILSVCCALYALPGFWVINCCWILLLSAAATFGLSGQSRHSLKTAALVPETIELSVLALFGQVGRPWEVLKALRRNRSALGRIALAVVVALPVVAVVLALLMSADAVFASFFDRLAETFAALGLGKLVWRLVRGLVLSLFVAAGLFFLRDTEPDAASPKEKKKQRHALPLLVSALLLDGIYLLFCSVQIRYLFGGHEAVGSGWASYAREGFFQLVAVAAINVGLCLIGFHDPAYSRRATRALQAADGLMLVFTAVILLSALRRMTLYIAAFGLSVLRLMTLWCMAMLALGLLAVGWKLFRPKFSFFAALAPVVLGSWCLLSLCNPGGIIARYNVNAYLSGQLSTVDVDYLEQLTPDGLSALYTLEEACPQDRPIAALVERVEATGDDTAAWTAWKGSFLFRR